MHPPDLPECLAQPAVLDTLLRENLDDPLLGAVPARVRRRAIEVSDLAVVAHRVEHGFTAILALPRAFKRREDHRRDLGIRLEPKEACAWPRVRRAQQGDVQMHVRLWRDSGGNIR